MMESHEYWRRMAYTMELLLEKAPTETDRRWGRFLLNIIEHQAAIAERAAAPPVEHDP